MKKKVFSLMMTLLLAFIGVAKAEVVTIGDGTSTTYVTPFNSLWGYSFVEQIYTASEIGTAGTINSISFNMSTSDSQTNQIEVFMKNVSRSTFSGSTDYEPVTASDMVFSGTVTFNNGWTTITLDTPFEYDGTSNLLVGMHEFTSGYSTRYFYYTTATDMVLSYHSDGSNPDPYNLGSYSGNKYTSPNRANIQIDITAGGGGGGDKLHVQYMDGENVVIDSLNLGVRPINAWTEPFAFTMYSEGPNYTVTVLDFTPSDGMFTVAGEELPFQVTRTDDVDLTIGINATTAGVIERQFVAITEGDRAAHIWPILVEMYNPAIPDVVEKAYDLGNVTSYVGIPANITPTELHNDYDLPFDDIEEGVDAVYKLTFPNDAMLNAYVSQGENGKVALYKEDFNGEGGPMATNYYTGPQVGEGGAAGAAFEAMIGDETTTTSTTYFPFHSLWNYSLSENIFLASELTEAGVTTAPMTSLSWYVLSTSCTTPQNNINIWMANVSDAALTATSHTTAGMTLVYSGNSVLPVAGQWNEFVFNQGNFAWDGHSNILILCQRQNGTYQGSISWQTHNPGFAGMCYAYTDNAPGYDATTQTYSMYTSTTNRPNIIMKGGGRDRNRDLVDFEDGNMPAGWDASQGYNDWYVDSEDYYGYAPAYNGSYSLYVDGNGAYGNDYFVSPAIQFSGAGSMSFAYATPSWAGDQNDLSVAYGTSANGPWTIFPNANELQSENWQTVNIDLSSLNGTYYIAFISYDGYGYCTAIDDININVPTTPTPGPVTPEGIAYGPEITNAAIEAGTYYLVASSTTPDFEVTINAEPMPCPAINAEGFVWGETPANDADHIEPGSVTLRWNIPAYATGWRIVFGSTYWPEANHPQTVMYPEDGSFATELANSFTVRNLWNNTNYFWRVEFNNGACPQGVSSPVFGFTTNLNIPTNLTAEDYTIFNDEHVVLHWNAVVDRTFRTYNVYRDGQLVGNTTVNNIGDATFTDELLPYNMNGYVYYVTAVYDEGESDPSDPVTVKVSGYGDVNGHVYEQDGTTGIAGATVTMVGLDEFNVSHTYTFQTNAQGYYSGHIYAGSYNGSASCNGYQTIDAPVQGNPIAINYNETNSPVDYILDENFDPVCGVIAEYYPDSLDPNSPYVKVYWGCGLPGSDIIEPFETGDFSAFDWQLDPTYPWTITTNAPYEGTYCMKSGGAGVANVVSNMTVTVEIPADGLMSFFGKISCESNWDYGYFYIDGVQKGSYTGVSNWSEKIFEITAGEHTFMWQYTKDGSVNSNDDCFYVDYISFYKQPEPPVPGMTYTFEDGTMQGWTAVDADGDGYNWMLGSDILSGDGLGHNGSNGLVLSQSYDNNFGVLYPDNYLISPQVELGGIVKFYACAQDAGYAAEHFGVAVSTTNTQPSSFTMVQEWTLSAKSVGEPNGKPVKGSRSGRAQGNWYEYTVDMSAYSGMGYVAIRHFNCSDMFYIDVDDITIGEPGKGLAETRRLSHYNVYRTNCYNDGPYTEENTVFLATVWVPDTVYMDVEWADLPAGVYKWGVGTVYVGNRGEEIEGEISWTEPINVNNGEMANRAEYTYGFEGGLEGWTVMDAPGSEVSWVHSDNNPGGYDYTVLAHGGTGFAMGYSFVDYDGAYQIDSYLVSPQKYSIGAGSSISFWADNANDSYPESFSICVATAANPTIADFTTVWTGAAKGNTGVKSESRHDGNRYENWRSHSVDLSAYAGQEVWIAFHDVNYDAYEAWIDDVTINATGGGVTPPTPPTPPTPGAHGLAEPRQSEIVWSNCLDKDMYLDHVSVNVLLNSADSPEGTEVTFTNLNEYEQQTYGGYNVTLDGSGYYLWDTFRKGEYAVKVEHVGYEPIADTVSIWETTDLRYVMIEIIYGVENVYVSRTGWAMWDPLDPQQGGSGINPTPGPQGGATTFSVGFEEGMPEGWTKIDANNDGNKWEMTSDIPTAWPYYASLTLDWYRTGTNAICSGSYINGVGAITPDDYLVTPQVTLAEGSTFSFWAAATDASYPADHFGVFVSDNGTSDWTMVNEWTLTAKGGSKAGDLRASRDGNGNRLGSWHQYSVDLSAYAGQKYIAIRHFNCNDQYIMCVDDIELTAGAKNGGERHLEHYKVMCTSIDGVPIFNHNTVYPFCQLSTNEPYNAPLVEGEHYLCKVAVMYSTGLSAWSEPVEWVYEPCDHWGPVDEVEVNQNANGNHIEWVFEHGFNPYGGDEPGPQPPTPGQNATITLTVGDVWGDGSGYQMLLDADANAFGTTIPETGALSTNCSGNEAIYAEFEYKIPTNADGNCSTQNIVLNNSVTIEIPAGTYDWCITNPTPGDRIWIASAQGNVGGRQNDYAFEAGKTYEFTVTMQGSNDAVNVVVTGGAKGNYAPLAAGEVKDMANVTPGNYGYIVRPAYSTSNMIGQSFNMVSETSLMFNIGDIANYDERVYFLYKLMSDSRFSVINAEQPGMFVVNGNENLNANFVDFIAQNISEFTSMDKYQAADMANAYKGQMPASMVNAMMTDLYIQSRENNMCEFADPFCTDNGMYEFPAGVNAGSGETGPDYDCLYTQPNPAWYYMRIGDPGAMDIHMYSTPEVDIDFCCWGPFEDPTTPCPNGLTEDKVVSCSYSTSWTEHCMIPATAQTGEYYILVITNYSNQPCNINFSMVAGAGSTDCGILPPVDIIGFLITMDGEYLAFAGPTDREFTHEGEFGDHVYCVRPIYPGEMTLPDHNYGWSMGCPVCAETNGEIVCEPGEAIHSERVDDNHIKVWWGNAPAAPINEWLYYDDGTNEDAIGLQSGGSFNWGFKIPAASLTAYEGCSVTKIAYFDYSAHTGTVKIYNGSNGNAPATLIGTYSYTATGTEDWVEWDIPAVAFNNTQDLWVVMNNNDGQYVAAVGPYTGDPNGTMISTDGAAWYTLDEATGGQLSGTWNLRCYVTNQAKGGEVVALNDAPNGTIDATIANAGVSKGGNAPAFMNRAELVKYNVYRSTEANGTYTLIGEVAETGADYYEYIDSPTEAGTYYYQVRAYYSNDCESDPAQAFDNPEVNYVSETTTAAGVDENSDNVALYPNPTKGNVTIEAAGMSRITVVSVLGQVVFDTELSADNYTLNMSQFNAGMYMVRVYTETGVTVKRVTVMQ